MAGPDAEVRGCPTTSATSLSVIASNFPIHIYFVKVGICWTREQTGQTEEGNWVCKLFELIWGSARQTCREQVQWHVFNNGNSHQKVVRLSCHWYSRKPRNNFIGEVELTFINMQHKGNSMPSPLPPHLPPPKKKKKFQ